jgi:hypothetical protein
MVAEALLRDGRLVGRSVGRRSLDFGIVNAINRRVVSCRVVSCRVRSLGRGHARPGRDIRSMGRLGVSS